MSQTKSQEQEKIEQLSALNESLMTKNNDLTFKVARLERLINTQHSELEPALAGLSKNVSEFSAWVKQAIDRDGKSKSDLIRIIRKELTSLSSRSQCRMQLEAILNKFDT